jgi:hypothetical protein
VIRWTVVGPSLPAPATSRPALPGAEQNAAALVRGVRAAGVFAGVMRRTAELRPPQPPPVDCDQTLLFHGPAANWPEARAAIEAAAGHHGFIV